MILLFLEYQNFRKLALDLICQNLQSFPQFLALVFKEVRVLLLKVPRFYGLLVILVFVSVTQKILILKNLKNRQKCLSHFIKVEAMTNF